MYSYVCIWYVHNANLAKRQLSECLVCQAPLRTPKVSPGSEIGIIQRQSDISLQLHRLNWLLVMSQ